MQNAPVFKKRYAIIVVLLIIFAYVAYRIAHFSPVEQVVIQKENVSNLVTLYVTEVNAGATTAFSYRLYLFDSKKNDKNFMSSLKEGNLQPFLITSDRNAFKKVENNSIYLSVKGDIFSFSNYPSIRINDVIYSVPVYLTSTPF